jgi:hypothetical protein
MPEEKASTCLDRQKLPTDIHDFLAQRKAGAATQTKTMPPRSLRLEWSLEDRMD